MYEFNNLVQACLPKKVVQPYEQGVACRAEETRAISCKCTDNKIILKAVAHSLNSIIAKEACELQQGFIPGRHFTNNIVVIDTVSRMHSNLHSKYGGAVAAFFDFGNAFPSLAVGWIMLVEWLEVPTGIYCLVQALYHDVSMYLQHAGSSDFLCVVQSGVLQGCPLAALLFVLAMEPFLIMFKIVIEEAGLGIVRACADDLAITLKSFESLSIVYSIFILLKGLLDSP